MRLSRIDIYTSLFAVYLVYSTIANYSVYFIGGLPKFIVVVLLCILGISLRPSIITRSNDFRLFILCWGIITFISIVINWAFPHLLFISGFIICLFFLSLNIEVQKSIFRKYVWFISVLFLLSAIEYVVFIVSGKGIIVATVTRITAVKEGTFYHYLFNIISIYDILYRFKGLCPEPGNMGTLCAFMLFATWRIKALRFPFFVFLACGMISLSLAYYIFLFIFLLTSLRPSIKNILIGIIIFATFIFVFRDYFEDRIINRLTEVDDVEELDNRTSDTFNRYFSKAFEKGDLWVGVGSNNVPSQVNNDGGNAGAKLWIYQYGIIGFVFIFCIYNFIYFQRSNKRLCYHDMVFLLVYWLCFYKSDLLTVPSIFVIYSMMPVINKKTNIS